jgi:hypothetical protein
MLSGIERLKSRRLALRYCATGILRPSQARLAGRNPRLLRPDRNSLKHCSLKASITPLRDCEAVRYFGLVGLPLGRESTQGRSRIVDILEALRTLEHSHQPLSGRAWHGDQEVDATARHETTLLPPSHIAVCLRYSPSEPGIFREGVRVTRPLSRVDSYSRLEIAISWNARSGRSEQSPSHATMKMVIMS